VQLLLAVLLIAGNVPLRGGRVRHHPGPPQPCSGLKYLHGELFA